MIIDFITRANNISYNVKLAKLFGLYSAVYLGLLLDCFFPNQEEFLKLSRDDIYNLSGIDEEKQLEVEDNLKAYNLIQITPFKNSSTKNYYKINIELLTQILTTENDKIKEELEKTCQTFTAMTKPPAKVSKRSNIINNLKNNITIADNIAREYLVEWVDAVMQKTGYLSKVNVQSVCEDLTNYAKGKVTVLRDVCKVAAIRGYKDSKWIIKNYEDNKDESGKFNLSNLSQEDIDDNINKLRQYKGDAF